MQHNGTIEWAPPPAPMVETIRETIAARKWAQFIEAFHKACRDLRDEWDTLGEEPHTQGAPQ